MSTHSSAALRTAARAVLGLHWDAWTTTGRCRTPTPLALWAPDPLCWRCTRRQERPQDWIIMGPVRRGLCNERALVCAKRHTPCPPPPLPIQEPPWGKKWQTDVQLKIHLL